jgi:hypothetical protein
MRHLSTINWLAGMLMTPPKARNAADKEDYTP